MKNLNGKDFMTKNQKKEEGTAKRKLRKEIKVEREKS
jgi:hypothetical protein